MRREHLIMNFRGLSSGIRLGAKNLVIPPSTSDITSVQPIFTAELERRIKYNSHPTVLTIVEREAAKMVMKCIRRKVCEGTVPLLEVNPGPGFLTEEILKAKITNLYVYEPRPTFAKNLENMLSKYGLEKNLVPRSYNSLFHVDGKPVSHSDTHFKDMLPFVPTRKWDDDEPSFRIVGAHANLQYWTWLLLHVSNLCHHHNWGRPELIICVPESELNPSSGQAYHPACMLISPAFELEMLGHAGSRKTFFPVKILNRKVRSETRAINQIEEMVVLRLIPVHNLFRLVHPDDVQKLIYFMKQTLSSKVKARRIVPELEKWIPGCGRDLVLAGIDITKKFQDLSSEEVLLLFHIFTSHPDSHSSAFFLNMG